MNNNIYHRYLSLPFTYPKPKQFNIPTTVHDALLEEPIFKPFEDWIKGFNLTISNVIEAFHTKPNGGRLVLHADTGLYKPGEHDMCKLNFTWGPNDSTTRWYKIKDESKLIVRYHSPDGSNKKVFDAKIKPDIDISCLLLAKWEDVDLVHEVVIDRPSLLNISQLHSTWNPSPTEGRWTLCFIPLEFGKPITFQRSLEIFKDYIVD